MPTLTQTRRALLGALMLSPLAAWPRRGAPGLMLAQEAPPDIDPAGWLVSEKFDGVRAFWDGRQLRFRSGLVVAAPAWFLARLPAVPLDGELWLGRGRFDATSAAVRRSAPVNAEWRALHYLVFDLPGAPGPFAERALQLRQLGVEAVAQQHLPDRAALQQRLAEVLAGGGEGLMLHRADALHHAGRSPALLKLKPEHDAEAQVLAHLPGQGRLQGRLGALRVRTAGGVVFDLGSGFSDAQRQAPPAVGAWVSYRHRGFTPAGVPRFASFLRLREEG